MDDLFRLITGNPILLFLIIGVILRFLQKGKEQETKKGEQGAPQTGAPKMEKEPSVEIDWQEIFRQEEKPKPIPRSEREQQYTYTEQPQLSTSDGNNQRANELLEKYEKAKQNKEAAKKYDSARDDSPIYKGDIGAQKEVKLDFSNITKEEAIAGVVWSEILGKPRCKGSQRPSLKTKIRRG